MKPLLNIRGLSRFGSGRLNIGKLGTVRYE